MGEYRKLISEKCKLYDGAHKKLVNLIFMNLNFRKTHILIKLTNGQAAIKSDQIIWYK